MGLQTFPEKDQIAASYLIVVLANTAMDICKWKEQGCVPIKLTLKTQVMDGIWPTDQSLPSPLLGQGVRGGESKLTMGHHGILWRFLTLAACQKNNGPG